MLTVACQNDPTSDRETDRLEADEAGGTSRQAGGSSGILEIWRTTQGRGASPLNLRPVSFILETQAEQGCWSARGLPVLCPDRGQTQASLNRTVGQYLC